LIAFWIDTFKSWQFAAVGSACSALGVILSIWAAIEAGRARTASKRAEATAKNLSEYLSKTEAIELLEASESDMRLCRQHIASNENREVAECLHRIHISLTKALEIEKDSLTEEDMYLPGILPDLETAEDKYREEGGRKLNQGFKGAFDRQIASAEKIVTALLFRLKRANQKKS